MTAAPMRSDERGLRGVVLVLHDLTLRTALLRSETRFRRLEEAGLLGTFETDLSGRISAANETFLRMVGRTRSDLDSEALTRQVLTPPEWWPADDAAFAELHQKGVSALREKEFFRADGTRLPVLVGPAMLDAQSAIVFVLDITRQKQLEAFRARSLRLETENERIKHANRLKTEFLANMSHELRTSLNSIIGFAELLHDDQVSPEAPQFKEFLGDILNSGRHLLQLINDVLDLSKVEAGRLEFRPEPIDLQRLAGEVVGILRTAAAQKHLTLSVELDPALTGLVLDASRLKQVLYNYLSNALKFTPAGGRVTLRAR